MRKQKFIKSGFEEWNIHSDRRFTYEEAQERIETKQGDLTEEILQLDKLAKIMRNERIRNGAITLIGARLDLIWMTRAIQSVFISKSAKIPTI